MKKFYLSIILCFCTLWGASAQNNDSITVDVTDSKNFKQWSVEFGAGMSMARGWLYGGEGDLGVNSYRWGYNSNHRFWNPGATVSVRYMFNNLAGIKANVGFVNYFNKKNSTNGDYDTKMFDGSLSGVLNLGRLVHMEEFSKRFNLLGYLGAGVGYNGSNNYPRTTKTNSDWTNFFIGGVTAQYLITNSIALQLDLSIRRIYMVNYGMDGVHFKNTKGIAGYGVGSRDGHIANANIGLAIYLGGADKRDKPHADWYYVKREAVPAAYVPTTPAELLVDTDGDGVPDYLDLCPDEPGLKELHGCPDRDGDGIPDYRDRCPDTPGLKEFFGCPEESTALSARAIQAVLAQDATNAIVYFDIDKNIIKLADYHTLYKFVYFVKERQPESKILVEGHTDETASEQYNVRLSQRRADAVKKFLLKEGLNEANISTAAFGESKPRATNATVAGRRENRRAELKIISE